MAVVRGDPDAIEGFAHALGSYCVFTRDNLDRLDRRLKDMDSNGGWDDEQYRKYCETFETARRAMGDVLNEIEEEHMRRLHGVVEQLREYLNG